MSSLSNSPRIRSAPHSRFFAAISLIKAMVSGDILGCVARAFDLCFQNKRNASRCQRSRVVFLDKEQGLLPCPNHPGQEHEKDTICLRTRWSFHLTFEDEELLS